MSREKPHKTPCPSCGAPLRIIDSRDRYGDMRVRRHLCDACGRRVNSVEVLLPDIGTFVGLKAEELKSASAQTLLNIALHAASKTALLKELAKRIEQPNLIP